MYGNRESNHMRRQHSLYFIRYMVFESQERLNKRGLPSPIIATIEGNISWRRQILEINAPFLDGSVDELSRFFRCDSKKSSNTFIVAVVGDKTLWGENIRHKIDILPENVDKIMLIEIPDNDVHWDSLKDYTVDETLRLWASQNFSRGFFQKRGLYYCTLRGKIGKISDFSSTIELRKMIELNCCPVGVPAAPVQEFVPVPVQEFFVPPTTEKTD